MEENTETNNLPIIYGVLLDPTTDFGFQAYAINGDTGEIIDSHFCSSEGFAKSDLGFTDPLMLKWDDYSDDTHSTVGFNAERKKKYMQLFPNGYTMQWIGNWRNSPKTIELFEKNNYYETTQ